MNPLIRAVVLIIPLVCFAYFTSELKKQWGWYIGLFLFFWLVQWYFAPLANSYEYTPRARVEIAQLMQQPHAALTQKTRAQYLSNAEYHTNKAFEEYNTARDICWWLPRQSDREKARKAITTFGTIALPTTPLHRCMATLIGLLVQYGVDCVDEWYNIKELLESAQYNSEMAQVYRDLVNNN